MCSYEIPRDPRETLGQPNKIRRQIKMRRGGFLYNSHSLINLGSCNYLLLRYLSYECLVKLKIPYLPQPKEKPWTEKLRGSWRNKCLGSDVVLVPNVTVRGVSN